LCSQELASAAIAAGDCDDVKQICEHGKPQSRVCANSERLKELIVCCVCVCVLRVVAFAAAVLHEDVPQVISRAVKPKHEAIVLLAVSVLT
jgi:hypothetical protein